jgi:hypothetical protein
MAEISAKPDYVAVDQKLCPHLITNAGYCNQCGEDIRHGLMYYEVAAIEALHSAAHDPSIPIEECPKPTCALLRQGYRYHPKPAA